MSRLDESARRAGGAGHCSSLTANGSPFFFGEATPDAGVLVRLQCEVEALAGDGTTVTHALRMIDRQQSMSRRANWKEQIGIGVSAQRLITPNIFSGGKGEAGRKDRH